MAEAYNPTPEGEVTLVGLAKELGGIFKAKLKAFRQSWKDDANAQRVAPTVANASLQRRAQAGEVAQAQFVAWNQEGLLRHPHMVREGEDPSKGKMSV